MSMGAVARKLNELSVPTKRTSNGWTASTIKTMIDNPIYYGQFTYFKNKAVAPKGSVGIGAAAESKTSSIRNDKSEWISIDVPAIVSRELWEACQQAKERNTLLSKRNGKLDYLLRGGMLVCGQCGLRYHGTTTHDRRIYRCGGGKPNYILKSGKRCSAPSLRAAELEEKIWSTILHRLQAIADVKTLFSNESEEIAEQREKDQLALMGVIAQEKELDQEQERLVSLYMRNAINDAIFDAKKAELDKRRKSIETLKAELNAHMSQQVDIKADAEALAELAESASRIEEVPFEHKRKILELLQTKITVNADGSMDIEGLITDRLLTTVSIYAKFRELLDAHSEARKNGNTDHSFWKDIEDHLSTDPNWASYDPLDMLMILDMPEGIEKAKYVLDSQSSKLLSIAGSKNA